MMFLFEEKMKFAQRIGANSDLVHQCNRLAKVFWAIEAALILLLIEEIVLDGDIAPAAIVTLSVVLTSVYSLIRNGRPDQASALLFWILMLSVSAMIWLYYGLRDEALVLIPVLVFTSAIVGDARLFFSLLVYAVGTILAVGIANEVGWVINETPATDARSSIILTIILLVVGYFSWLLAAEIRTLLEKLQLENGRLSAANTKIQRLIHCDALTGLPNRELARIRFVEALLSSKRDSNRVGLMFLGIDNFKAINDSFGHRCGDKFLKDTATRLSSVVRKSDSVCRHGGDKFLVVLGSIKSNEEIVRIALEILEEFKRPIELGDSLVASTVSIGVAVTDEKGSSFEIMCKQADAAMYHAKEEGRNGYRFFNQDMGRDAKRQLGLLTDMHKAVEEGQYELHYQPKFDLESGNVLGAEALIRWRHPVRGLILPGEFIPLAERSGHIVDISEWALRESCRQCKIWHAQGYPELSVAVNVSSIHLKRSNLVDLVQSVLQETGLSPQKLELELTESLLIDDSVAVAEALSTLRTIGVELSIDDFGTGYSSLRYLQRFDVSILKIDRCFIKDILCSSQDRAIVEAIVQMSTSLGLKSIAEGVESAEQEVVLSALGCDMGQGYYWARPLPPHEFLVFLSNTKSAVVPVELSRNIGSN